MFGLVSSLAAGFATFGPDLTVLEEAGVVVADFATIGLVLNWVAATAAVGDFSTFFPF